MLTSPDNYKKACRALLRSFEPDNHNVENTIETAASVLVGNVPAPALADLNDGQYAAVVDFIIAHGAEVFVHWSLRDMLVGGNLTLAPDYLTMHVAEARRGKARRDVWNVGNSQ